jgi:hypothetical protein
LKELAHVLPLSLPVNDTAQALSIAQNALPTGLECPTLCHGIGNASQALTRAANGSGFQVPDKGLKVCE